MDKVFSYDIASLNKATIVMLNSMIRQGDAQQRIYIAPSCDVFFVSRSEIVQYSIFGLRGESLCY